MKKLLCLLLICFSILGLSSCNESKTVEKEPTLQVTVKEETPTPTKEPTPTPEPEPTPIPTPTPTPEVKCSLCAKTPTAEKVVREDLAEHTPTTFDAQTVEVETLAIYDGVIQKTYTFKKNNGKTSKVVVTEVDLSKVSIGAGTYENRFSSIIKSTPISQALAYESANEGVSVLAAVNADFFGGDACVNAFVKDSVIIKSGHNDRGIYDYTNLDADLPASMPMLFGVSGEVAQVAPIIQNASVEETVKAKLSYELNFTNKDNTTTLTEGITFNNEEGSKTMLNIITSDETICTALPGSKVLSIKKHITNTTRVHGEIEDVTEILGTSIYRANEDYFYIVIPEESGFNDYQIGDLVSYNVTSPDETWKYYDTIIGCRQALVIDGEIASTVTKENSNGAQGVNVPRTAVGVMPNGLVAIFSVESLSYGNITATNSTSGLSLPELADFMRYYGVYSGANFDGGGSTQLITKNPNTNEFEVVVRSSDYGTFNLENSRKVINTLLVYTKEKE